MGESDGPNGAPMWVKLDDHFVDHPKILAAGPVAGWLFVAGLCYANRLLTDGFIPETQVTRLVTPHVTRDKHANGNNLAHKLCTVGLWKRVTIEGVKGYQVHDFLEYQPSKQQVITQRKRASSRQSRHRSRRDKPVTKMSRPLSRVTSRVPIPDPIPVRTREGEEGAPARPSDPNADRTQPQRRRVAPDGRAKRAASAPVVAPPVSNPEGEAIFEKHFGVKKK